MTDHIEIQLDLSPESDYSYSEDGKISSYTNVEQPDGQHYFLSATCVINGEKINQSFSVYAFLRSVKTGSHEIFTCSCGIAGCAGIWDGIKVKNRRHTVEWRTPVGSNYSCLSKRFYSFEKAKYDIARENLYAKLIEYSASIMIHDQFPCGELNDGDLVSCAMRNYNKAYRGKWWYE